MNKKLSYEQYKNIFGFKKLDDPYYFNMIHHFGINHIELNQNINSNELKIIIDKKISRVIIEKGYKTI